VPSYHDPVSGEACQTPAGLLSLPAVGIIAPVAHPRSMTHVHRLTRPELKAEPKPCGLGGRPADGLARGYLGSGGETLGPDW
jgi:hypothetical protein